MDKLQPKTLILASPRGFCAGVERAIKIVERALDKFGAPIYVRHEIVHNKRVVDDLAAKGAVFVKELDEVPQGGHVIFSAHGVAKAVHNLIETAEDALAFTPPGDSALAFATQTTLSADETAEIITILQHRFPEISGPQGEDICYATTNRQNAIKALAPDIDYLLVIGAQNSSNSKRLVETGLNAGVRAAMLAADAAALDFDALDKASRIGLSAGASAPEILVEEVIDALQARYQLAISHQNFIQETMHFKLPAILSE
ncbi:MAG: 4-hydroxy-3-methylbut-2-enyl diphosphate reductase [Proteobacteria bacterium]|nr:4-hydroxy-3-methylbut-2-enyl diphosphate reductase [Pseudomonadota bacterium]